MLPRSVVLTPAFTAPKQKQVMGLSSLGQLLLASLTPASPPPPLPLPITDPSLYYKQVYYRQFQAEPVAQPGSTQPCSQVLLGNTGEQGAGNTFLAPPSTQTADITSLDSINRVYGAAVVAGRLQQADPHPQQQDPSPLWDLDFDDLDWSEIEAYELTSNNPECNTERVLLTTSSKSSLTGHAQQSEKIAQRIVHTKISNEENFDLTGFELTPQDEAVMEKLQPQNPNTLSVPPSGPPVHLGAPNDSIFDISLSPIFGSPPPGETFAATKAALEIVTSNPLLTACGSITEFGFTNSKNNLDHETPIKVDKKGCMGELAVVDHCSSLDQYIVRTSEEVRDIVGKKTLPQTPKEADGGTNSVHVAEKFDGLVCESEAAAESSSIDALCIENPCGSAADGKLGQTHSGATEEGDARSIMEHLRMESEYHVKNNNSIEFFDTSSDVVTQVNAPSFDLATDGKGKLCDKVGIKTLEASCKVDVGSVENDVSVPQSKTQTPSRKPTFRVPFKVLESPIVGYPQNKKNITSTPKDMQQTKVRRFGSGYSSDENTLTSNSGASTGHRGLQPAQSAVNCNSLVKMSEKLSSNSGLSLITKTKHKLQPKFVSRLSSFKFSVDNSRIAQKKLCNLQQISSGAKVSEENAMRVSVERKFEMPLKSCCKSSLLNTDTFVKAQELSIKWKDVFQGTLTKDPQETEVGANHASNITQEINTTLLNPKQNLSGVAGRDSGTFKNMGETRREMIKENITDYTETTKTHLSKKLIGEGESCSSHEKDELSDVKRTGLLTSIALGKISGRKRKSENKGFQEKQTVKKKEKVKIDNYLVDDSKMNTKISNTKKLRSVIKKTVDRKPCGKAKNIKGRTNSKRIGNVEKCKSNSNGGGEEKSRNVGKLESAQTCEQQHSPQHLPQGPSSSCVLGDESQLLAVSDHLLTAMELCFTLLYRDGSSQLRERVCGGRKQHAGSGQVTGFALKVTWDCTTAPPLTLLPSGSCGRVSEPCEEESQVPTASGLVEGTNIGNKEKHAENTISVVYKISLGINFNKEKIRCLVDSMMKSKVQKVSFDAQESITFLVEKLQVDHKDVIKSWKLLDPKVGGWLLDSDHPPVTFQQTALALQVPLPQIRSKHPEETLHNDLEALSRVMATLHSRLRNYNLWTIFLHLEMRILPILAVMELRDIQVDRSVLKQTGQRLKLSIQEVERRCHQVSGSVFNVASHAQLRSVLYQELKLDLKARVTVPRTAGGQKSTCEAALSRLGSCHPLPGLVLQHRLLNKLKTTYVDGILACVHGSSVRAAWEQTSASTGRIQCRNPNLQGIPKQPVTVHVEGSEMVVRARACFCSKPGYVLVAADFQQTELRVLAHLSQDAMLLAGFTKPLTNSTDIFKQLSAVWLGKEAHEVTSSERERTKKVVYAVMYGAGKEKLAEVLHVTHLEARDIISSFIKNFPSIPAYMRSVVELCRRQGFLTTIFGRRRFFPGITSQDPTVRAQAERQAVNFIIQGSAADISKAAMVQMEAALASEPDLDAKLLIHIHDELVWEVKSEHNQAFCGVVGRVMEDTEQLCGPLVQLTVPFPITVCSGTSWAHMYLDTSKGTA